jgi:hypothetical protein
MSWQLKMNKKSTFYTYSTASTAKTVDAVSSTANLTHNAIDKSSLHLRNLLLEGVNLLPAIQWPAVVQSQTSNNISLGLFNTLIQLNQLPPPIQTATQHVNLTHNRVPRDLAVDNGRLLCDGFLRRGEDRRGLVLAAGEGDPWGVQVQRSDGVARGGGGEGRGGSAHGDGAGVLDFGEALLDLGEGLLLAFAETLEFLGDAVLDLELEGLGAGGVRLLCGMCMSKEYHGF